MVFFTVLVGCLAVAQSLAQSTGVNVPPGAPSNPAAQNGNSGFSSGFPASFSGRTGTNQFGGTNGNSFSYGQPSGYPGQTGGYPQGQGNSPYGGNYYPGSNQGYPGSQNYPGGQQYPGNYPGSVGQQYSTCSTDEISTYGCPTCEGTCQNPNPICSMIYCGPNSQQQPYTTTNQQQYPYRGQNQQYYPGQSINGQQTGQQIPGQPQRINPAQPQIPGQGINPAGYGSGNFYGNSGLNGAGAPAYPGSPNMPYGSNTYGNSPYGNNPYGSSTYGSSPYGSSQNSNPYTGASNQQCQCRQGLVRFQGRCIPQQWCSSLGNTGTSGVFTGNQQTGMPISPSVQGK